jgi:hypothetical protein
MTTLVIDLKLADSNPPVWRKLSVPGRYRLDQVHRMFQILFGWQDYHLHEFFFGETRYTDLETLDGWDDGDNEDEKVRLDQALGRGKSFLYRYDFGDSWEVKATVRQRLHQDSDAPVCLDGALAGPPEDCGGTPGFRQLKTILANPKHHEHEDMKRWIPKGWSSQAFSLESANKKLARAFGRKRAAPKAPAEALLAGYRLSKLSSGHAAIAALEESSPRTLDEIASRLTELGYPLPQGIQTLLRAIAKVEGIRQRVDGALELVPGRELDKTKSWMRYHSELGTKAPVRPAPEPERVEGPVSWEEIESARPYGLFPPQFSLRRRLILAVDAEGGGAGLEEALGALQGVEQTSQTYLSRDARVTLKGCSALRLQDGILALDRGNDETTTARAKFRDWLAPYRKRVLEAEQRKEANVGRKERRLANLQAQREELFWARKAVLAGYHDDTAFALVLLDAKTGQTEWLTFHEQATARLATYDVLCGLDPRSEFEKLSWSCQGKLVVDLRPPFKSRPLGGGRRKSVTLAQAIEMSTGQQPTDPKQVGAWLAGGQEGKARAALEADARNLLALWRYGVLHHGVRRDYDLVGVEWNVCKDISLSYALEWSLEDQRPLLLTLKDGQSDFFQPTNLERQYLYTGERIVLGQWQGSTKIQPLVLVNVIHMEYPHEVSPERLSRVFW